jgi:hypothetical protein
MTLTAQAQSIYAYTSRKWTATLDLLQIFSFEACQSVFSNSLPENEHDIDQRVMVTVYAQLEEYDWRLFPPEPISPRQVRAVITHSLAPISLPGLTSRASHPRIPSHACMHPPKFVPSRR